MFQSFTLIFLLNCCIQEESNKYQTSTFTLANIGNEEQPILSWESVNSKFFEEYILVSSNSRIPDFESRKDFKNVNIIKIITKPKDTSFSTLNLLSTTYFRVFVSINGRLIASSEIILESNQAVLFSNNEILQTLVDEEKGVLYCFMDDQTIERIDLRKNENTNRVAISGMLTDTKASFDIHVTPNGNTLVYTMSDNQIIVLNGDNLSEVEKIQSPYNGKILQIAVAGSGKIYFTDNYSNNTPLVVYNPSNKTFTRILNSGSGLNMIKLNKKGDKIYTGIESTNSTIKFNRLSQDDKIISSKTLSNQGINWSSTNNVAIDALGDLFYDSNSGTILDSSFRFAGHIGRGFPPEFEHIIISPDNKFIIAHSFALQRIHIFNNNGDFKLHSKFFANFVRFKNMFVYKNQPYLLAEILNINTGKNVTLVFKAVRED